MRQKTLLSQATLIVALFYSIILLTNRWSIVARAEMRAQTCQVLNNDLNDFNGLSCGRFILMKIFNLWQSLSMNSNNELSKINYYLIDSNDIRKSRSLIYRRQNSDYNLARFLKESYNHDENPTSLELEQDQASKVDFIEDSIIASGLTGNRFFNPMRG